MPAAFALDRSQHGGDSEFSVLEEALSPQMMNEDQSEQQLGLSALQLAARLRLR